VGAIYDVGSWGLFCGQEGRQVVMIDGQPCGPNSARKQMRRVPRELLMEEDRFGRAWRTGERIDETVVREGCSWRVVVRPKLSPRSGCVIGALAAVYPANADLPDPPQVGGWEWEIELDENHQPTPRRRTYWDRELYALYEVDPVADQQSLGYWEAGQWANELIDKADQMRVGTLVRDGIQEGLTGVGKMGETGTVRCLTYHVVTGYGSRRRGRKHLRLVGQIVPVLPDDGKVVIQGFSYEVPEAFHDMTFVQDANAGRVDDVLRGVMSLSRELMAVVDVDTLELLMTSASWRDEGLGHVGGLGRFAEDVSGDLHGFIRDAATDAEDPSCRRIQLRRMDGTALSVDMTVIGVRSGEHGRDALVRLDF
jgi:hypothetical protein